MSPKILRRCTICKKFHASYLADDPELGKCYLCLSCWKARSMTSKELQLRPSKAGDEIEGNAQKKSQKVSIE